MQWESQVLFNAAETVFCQTQIRIVRRGGHVDNEVRAAPHHREPLPPEVGRRIEDVARVPEPRIPRVLDGDVALPGHVVQAERVAGGHAGLAVVVVRAVKCVVVVVDDWVAPAAALPGVETAVGPWQHHRARRYLTDMGDDLGPRRGEEAGGRLGGSGTEAVLVEPEAVDLAVALAVAEFAETFSCKQVLKNKTVSKLKQLQISSVANSATAHLSIPSVRSRYTSAVSWCASQQSQALMK